MPRNVGLAELAELTMTSLDEAYSDLALIECANSPADYLACYWYVN